MLMERCKDGSMNWARVHTVGAGAWHSPEAQGKVVPGTEVTCRCREVSGAVNGTDTASCSEPCLPCFLGITAPLV